ncbi:MAG: RidA family protein [Gammaproteobacteria bacterium]|nr:RidA family protein [Gammaproteobacteria bacterium]
MQSVVPEGQQATYDSSHFSPGVIDGDRIFVSGIIGVDADGRVPSDPEAQFVCAFEGVRTVLEAAGGSLTDIVDIVSYHIDFHDHLATFFRVKDQYIKEPYPAWTAVGVSALARRNALVEIKVIASHRP